LATPIIRTGGVTRVETIISPIITPAVIIAPIPFGRGDLLNQVPYIPLALVGGFGGAFGDVGVGKNQMKKPKYGYQSSFVARYFGISAKSAPSRLSGLEVRPMIKQKGKARLKIQKQFSIGQLPGSATRLRKGRVLGWSNDFFGL